MSGKSGRLFLLVGLLVLNSNIAFSQSWTVQFPNQRPSGRFSFGMAYDSARREVLIFGGRKASQALVDSTTWVWKDGNWLQKAPLMSPSPRSSPAMAFDSFRNEIVLFGGLSADPSGETWVWNSSTWTQRFPSTAPPPRFDGAMAYDSVRHETVLFGGKAQSVLFDDTWVWDGNNWAQRFPGTSPSARIRHDMTYDAARGEVVLFGGGLASFPSLTDDTWVWDGVNWTRRFPATSPPATGHHAMAYDQTRGRVILFGGRDNGGFNRNDTWSWNGTNWTQLLQASSPPQRAEHNMAYDSDRSEIVLFGGTTFFGDAFDNSWVFRLTRAQLIDH